MNCREYNLSLISSPFFFFLTPIHTSCSTIQSFIREVLRVFIPSALDTLRHKGDQVHVRLVSVAPYLSQPEHSNGYITA